MKLHELLAIGRECSGLSLRQLAAKTGIPFQTISNIETGYAKEPSWRNVVKIARALNLKLDRLAECE